jgi:anti-sigma factor RsiW
MNKTGSGSGTGLNCEYVLDVYPDVLSGKADAALAQSVRTHIASCDECRADAAVIEAIRAQPTPLPAGLHERVLHAAAQPQSRWRIGRSELAMAATLAVALIGGAIIMQTQMPSPRVNAPVATQAPHSIGAVGVEDAMLSGKSSLEDLSVEQLEKLLGEIES